jgi:hypothetical protein
MMACAMARSGGAVVALSTGLFHVRPCEFPALDDRDMDVLSLLVTTHGDRAFSMKDVIVALQATEPATAKKRTGWYNDARAFINGMKRHGYMHENEMKGHDKDVMSIDEKGIIMSRFRKVA